MNRRVGLGWWVGEPHDDGVEVGKKRERERVGCNRVSSAAVDDRPRLGGRTCSQQQR